MQNGSGTRTDTRMRALSHLLVLACTAGLLTLGCERHDFEVTKKLHLEHGGGHGHGDHEGGKHGHGDEDAHHGAKAHGEGEKKASKEGGDRKDEKPRDLGI